jgi:hypothetical protein
VYINQRQPNQETAQINTIGRSRCSRALLDCALPPAVSNRAAMMRSSSAISSISARDDHGCRLGWSRTVTQQPIATSNPAAPSTMNGARQEPKVATNPMMIGAPIAPPSGLAEVAAPIAVDSFRSGNHKYTAFAVSGGTGPSAAPNTTRMTAKDRKLNPAAVIAVKTDQIATAEARTLRGPYLSAAHPPINWNGAHPQ